MRVLSLKLLNSHPKMRRGRVGFPLAKYYRLGIDGELATSIFYSQFHDTSEYGLFSNTWSTMSRQTVRLSIPSLPWWSGNGSRYNLAAVKNGAGRVEGTINGIEGSRPGNAALEVAVAFLIFTWTISRSGVRLSIMGNLNTSELVSRFTLGLQFKNKAVVGGNAFSHESGIHQDGVIKNPAYLWNHHAWVGGG